LKEIFGGNGMKGIANQRGNVLFVVIAAEPSRTGSCRIGPSQRGRKRKDKKEKQVCRREKKQREKP